METTIQGNCSKRIGCGATKKLAEAKYHVRPSCTSRQSQISVLCCGAIPVQPLAGFASSGHSSEAKMLQPSE